jgi:hypothetical protein
MKDFASDITLLCLPLHALTHHEYIEEPQYPRHPASAAILDRTAQIARAAAATLVDYVGEGKPMEVNATPHTLTLEPGVEYVIHIRKAGSSFSFEALNAIHSRISIFVCTAVGR